MAPLPELWASSNPNPPTSSLAFQYEMIKSYQIHKSMMTNGDSRSHFQVVWWCLAPRLHKFLDQHRWQSNVAHVIFKQMSTETIRNSIQARKNTSLHVTYTSYHGNLRVQYPPPQDHSRKKQGIITARNYEPAWSRKKALFLGVGGVPLACRRIIYHLTSQVATEYSK